MSAPDYAQCLIERFFLHSQGRPQMRTWAIERRMRTRHLIELGGLVVKANIVELTGDDRATIYGAMIWMADKLKSDEREKALALWAGKGKTAFEAERDSTNPAVAQQPSDRA